MNSSFFLLAKLKNIQAQLEELTDFMIIQHVPKTKEAQKAAAKILKRRAGILQDKLYHKTKGRI